MMRGGLAGAAAFATGACAFAPASSSAANPSPSNVETEAAVVPRIDGDLVYFNWADYVDPSVFEGFQKEYGVKVIQSAFDSMEAMVANGQQVRVGWRPEHCLVLA